jgi:transposase-like protein
MEAYIGGVSTRKVDALVAALGVQSGISRSRVYRICADIDIQVQAFLTRPLQESDYPDGRRELLGLQVGDSESEGFWKAFIGSLKERSLTGIKLVVCDAHVGLTKAIRRMFQGCCWQRCRVHHRFAEGFAYARNLLQRVPKAHQGMVTAALRSVFSQENAAGLVERWDDLAASLDERFPKAAELMLESPLEKGVEHQPARAVKRGGETPHPRGRHLSERRLDHSPGGRGAARAGRALAARGQADVLP